MAEGLKEIFGVDEPAKSGSDKQSKDFKKDFKSGLKGPDANLVHLAALAPANDHGALDGERDKVYGAYQKTLKAIDPADAKKASGKIKQVLTALGNLDKKVGKLRQTTDACHAAWKAVEPQYDTVDGQTQELETWGMAGCAAWLSASREIADGVTGRRWSEAKDGLGKLLKDVEAPYQEYLRQKDAKALYDKEKPVFDKAQLDLGAPPEPSEPMLVENANVLGQLPLLITAEVEKNYVGAREFLATASDQLATLKTLAEDPNRLAYLTGHPDVDSLVDQCSAIADPFMATVREAILGAHKAMQSSALAGSYAEAMTGLNSLIEDGADYLATAAQNSDAKAAYETARPDFETRQAIAASLPEPSGPMTALGPTISALAGAAADLVGLHNYIEGEPELCEAIASLEELEGLGNDPDRLAYLGAKVLALGQAVAADLIVDPFVESLREPYRSAQAAMLAAAEAGTYGVAMTSLQALMTAADALLAKAEENKQAKADYTAKRGAFDGRLTTATGYVEPSAPMTAMRNSIDPAVGQVDTAVAASDYISGLALLGEADAILIQLEALGTDPDRLAYLDAKPGLETRMADADQVGPTWMAEMRVPYADLHVQMQGAAEGGDYKGALGHLKAAEASIAAFLATVEENTVSQGLYTGERTDFDARWTTTQGYPEPSDPMIALSGRVTEALPQADSAAALQNFIEALPALRAAAEPLAELETAGLDPNRLAYLGMKAAAEAAIVGAAAIDNPSLAALKEPFESAASAMTVSAKAGDYAVALSQASAANAAALVYMEEARKDSEAETVYRPEREAIESELTLLLGEPEPSEPMAAAGQGVEQSLVPAQAKADQGDFDQALLDLGPARGALDTLRGLVHAPDRVAYLGAKPALDEAIAAAQAADATAGGRLARHLEPLDPSAAEASARSGDYGAARALVDALIAAAGEVLLLLVLLEQYDQALTKLRTRIADCEAVPEPNDPMLDIIGEAKDAAAQAEAKLDGGDIQDAIDTLGLGDAALDRFDEAARDPMRRSYLDSLPQFVPPFVPSGPVVAGDNIFAPGHFMVSFDEITGTAKAGDYATAVAKMATMREEIAVYTAAVEANAEAKTAYEAERPMLDQSLAQLMAQPEPSDPMSALTQQVQGQLAASAALAGAENYIQAREDLEAPRLALSQLETLANNADRLAYLGVAPVVGALLAQAAQVNDPFLETDRAAFAGVLESAQTAARAGSYEAALDQLTAANAAVSAFLAKAEENQLAKAAYSQDRAAFDARHSMAKSLPEPSDPMKALAGDVETALTDVDAAATAGDYLTARDALGGASTALQALETAGSDPDRMAYLLGKPVTEGLIVQAETIDNPSLASMKSAFASAAAEMAAAAAAGDYKAAAATMNAATLAVSEYLNEAQRDLDAQAAYEQERTAFEAALSQLKSADRPTNPMTDLAGKIDDGLAALDAEAKGGDYDGLLTRLRAAKDELQQLTALTNDPKRLTIAKALDDLEAKTSKTAEPANA